MLTYFLQNKRLRTIALIVYAQSSIGANAEGYGYFFEKGGNLIG